MSNPKTCKINRLRIDQGVLNGFKIESEGTHEVTMTVNVRVTPSGMKVISPVTVFYKTFAESTRQQMNLCRSLERMLYTVVHRVKPSKLNEDEWHEVCLSSLAPVDLDGQIIRTSKMTRRQLSEYCEKLIGEIMEQDQGALAANYNPASITSLFATFHSEWQEANDILTITSWDEYRRRVPFCEFTFAGYDSFDPLERMHIISAGANGEIYEEPWNWIHAKHSVHMEQHQKGWDAVLDKYPHMMKRWAFAHEMERRINHASSFISSNSH